MLEQLEFQVDMNVQWTDATNAAVIHNVRRPIMGPAFIQSVYSFLIKNMRQNKAPAFVARGQPCVRRRELRVGSYLKIKLGC